MRPVGRAHLLDAGLPHHTGIVDQHIQPSTSLDHARHHLRRGIRVGEVGADRFMVKVITALRCEYPRAFIAQTVGNRLADAASPAGDKRQLSFKSHLVPSPVFTSSVMHPRNGDKHLGR